ncbi:MAG TPA: DinB family protein [Bryobacteraceae bacterium]|nr:DinB family protein [Bryobacteraceae bacterium]
MTCAETVTKLLARADSARRTFLSRIDTLSQQQIDFKPARSEWSIGEVAHHVVLTEQTMQATVKDLLERGAETGSATKTIGFEEQPMGPRLIPPGILRLPVVNMPMSMMMGMMPGFMKSFMLANPIMKIRTAPSVEPRAGMPREELLGLLARVRAQTLALIEPVRDKDLSRYRWSYPFLGTRNIYSTLEMLADHDHRHVIQIERIKRAPAFPTA